MKYFLFSEKVVTTFLAISLLIVSIPMVYVYVVITSQKPEANAEAENVIASLEVSDRHSSPLPEKLPEKPPEKLPENLNVANNVFLPAPSDVINQSFNEHQSSNNDVTTQSKHFQSKIDSESVLLEIESMLLTPTTDLVAGEHRLDELQNQLMVAASTDMNLRHQLIQVLRNNLGTPFGNTVQEILVQLSGHELVELGFELIEINDVVGIEPGLALVEKNAPNDPRALPVAELLIQQHSSEPQIVNLAIDIMMQSPNDENNTDYNFSILSELTQHHDSEVRSNSIFRYASLARDEYDLDLVVKALHSPNKIDRMSAAQALSISSIKSDSIRNELITKANDPNELLVVRQAAAEGLNGLNLSIEEQEIVAKLQDVEYEF